MQFLPFASSIILIATLYKCFIVFKSSVNHSPSVSDELGFYSYLNTARRINENGYMNTVSRSAQILTEKVTHFYYPLGLYRIANYFSTQHSKKVYIILTSAIIPLISSLIVATGLSSINISPEIIFFSTLVYLYFSISPSPSHTFTSRQTVVLSLALAFLAYTLISQPDNGTILDIILLILFAIPIPIFPHLSQFAWQAYCFALIIFSFYSIKFLLVFCIGIYLSVHFKNTFLKLDSQLRMSYLLNQRYKVMSLESQNKYKGNIPNLELVIKKILYLLSPTDAFRKQWNAKSLGIDKHSIMSSFNVFALCLFVWVFDNNNLNSEIFNIAIVASLYLLVVPLIVSFYPFNGFGPSLRYIQSGEAILYLLFAIISLTYGPNPLASTIAINLIVLLDIYF